MARGHRPILFYIKIPKYTKIHFSENPEETVDKCGKGLDLSTKMWKTFNIKTTQFRYFNPKRGKNADFGAILHLF